MYCRNCTAPAGKAAKSVSINPTVSAPPTNQVSSEPVHSSAAAQGLTVAAGATQVLDLSTTPILNLTVDLKNDGILYVISTNPLVSNVTLQAQNIFNSSGATITTVLPAGGLAGFSNAIHNLSLTLVAVQNIVNHGMIMSSRMRPLVFGSCERSEPKRTKIGSKPCSTSIWNRSKSRKKRRCGS